MSIKMLVLSSVLKPFSAHQQRHEMDRRRFESAHLKYACLQMAAQYPEAINTSCVGVEGDVTHTLNNITPILFSCFEARYAGRYSY